MLKIAVSSRTLFDIEDGHKVWLDKGQEAFTKYMIKKEDTPLKPGVAFPLVSKLLAMNKEGEAPLVGVVVLSRNSPASGMRVMNSIQHYGLFIEQAAFTSGRDRFEYAKAMNVSLFISANQDDAAAALSKGLPAAVFLPGQAREADFRNELRVAFDGDSVIFSDEADRVFRENGLTAFRASEESNARVPLAGGPFKSVLEKLHELRLACPDLVRIALITARGIPAHGRAVTTLRSWGIEMDEMVFCAGSPKGEILKAFGADLFFDDTKKHVDSGHAHGVLSGYVPQGEGGIVAEAAIAA